LSRDTKTPNYRIDNFVIDNMDSYHYGSKQKFYKITSNETYPSA